MKVVERLTEATKPMKIGNHSKVFEGGKENFYYHWTVIISIDSLERTITVDDGGFKTSSTTRAINSYLRSAYIVGKVENLGYKIIDKRK